MLYYSQSEQKQKLHRLITQKLLTILRLSKSSFKVLDNKGFTFCLTLKHSFVLEGVYK